ETYNLITKLGIAQVFTPSFLHAVDVSDPALEQKTTYAKSTGTALINQMLAYDWKYTLADNDLIKVSGAAQAAGIEVGYPLLDDDLVDLSLRLSPDLKLRRLKLRYFFKDALRDFLPTEIINKKKHGFGLPFGPWIVKHPTLRTEVEDLLHSFAARKIVR